MWGGSGRRDAQRFYKRYLRIWPLIRRYPANRRGVYFHRLIAYGPEGSPDGPLNQLEHIIRTYRSGNHRRSGLQAAVFDPSRDLTNSRQQGFPCLQQMAFAPEGNKGFSVVGFYATQYLFDRAYGNLLGLCRLGQFMARQMGLTLTRVTCIAAVAQRGKANKTALTRFARSIQRVVPKDGETR